MNSLGLAKVRTHLANQRTGLAYIRTGLALIGVSAKFEIRIIFYIGIIIMLYGGYQYYSPLPLV